MKPIIEWLVAVHDYDPAPKQQEKGLNELKRKCPKIGDEMVVDPNDPDCGFQEVGAESIIGGDDPGEQSALIAGL